MSDEFDQLRSALQEASDVLLREAWGLLLVVVLIVLLALTVGMFWGWG